MKLETFVAETLQALVSGVRDAQKGVEADGAMVNPFRGSQEALQDIEFEVELSTVDDTATEGKLGVFVGPVGAGTKGQSGSTSSSVGRVRFRVPLQLPVHPDQPRPSS